MLAVAAAQGSRSLAEEACRTTLRKQQARTLFLVMIPACHRFEVNENVTRAPEASTKLEEVVQLASVRFHWHIEAC